MPDAESVFLNVPFDRGYESLFVTLVGTLVFLGQKPRCVLEIQETGQGRLTRIFQLVGNCGMSIHDLSRVGRPARFNMPFELGLACGLSLSSETHQVVVFDSKPYRLDKTLSDYKGRDPLLHKNRCTEMISCLLDLLVANDPLPSFSSLCDSAAMLRAAARELKREMGSATVFRAAAYRSLVAAATQIAVRENFIAPRPRLKPTSS